MRLCAIPVALTLYLIGAPALAAPDKARAREASEEGKRQYEVGNFQAALDDFKRAYLLYQEPAFLFNIAQCERMLGHPSDALREYRFFLRKLPETPSRPEVDRIIADLEAALAKEKPPQEAPPVAAEAPPVAAETKIRTTVATTPSLAVSPSPGPAIVLASPLFPNKRPVFRKWWLWALVGTVAVGATVGVGLGLGLRPSSNTTLTTIGPNSSAVRE